MDESRSTTSLTFFFFSWNQRELIPLFLTINIFQVLSPYY